MNDKTKKILKEMRDFKSSPRYIANRFHHEIIHDDVHMPIFKHLITLGFFTNKPIHKNGISEYSIQGGYRGNEVLTHQLGIGKSLIPIPQHHPKQEHSVKYLVDRAFSKKPSKYLLYLKTLHDGLSSSIEKHRERWRQSHKMAVDSLRSMKQNTMNSLSKSIPLGNSIEQHQLQAHHHQELAAEHEKNIKELEHHRRTIVHHANALGHMFGIDASEKSIGDLNSSKIVGGIWDEVL